MPNLGIGIDSFHALAAHARLDELEMILPDAILTVQLSDFMVAELASDEERLSTASHLRVFPGEGMHSARIAELVQRLSVLGFRGDYSFAVFNDDYRQMDPARVAERARKCAIWLGEEVLQRAVPMPWSKRLVAS
jgi:sugar phosphate isomerase/epimerase